MTAPRIHLLPPDLIDQIAAGEVVERPASVVKELVENSLDAGARHVEVQVEGGGRTLLRIADDGCGMTPEEMGLAIARHATSKLATADDLFRLETMGFRGEALPSIASVSRMTITSRPAGAIEGFALPIDAGAVGEGRAVGAPIGTIVEVRDLLHNTPARLKFLKADATETAHVSEAVLRLALANPGVHFRLLSGGRPLLDLPPHPSLLERARVALGRRGPAHLIGAEGERDGIRVVACLGSPTESATTSRGTYVLVNRRFVRDRGLLQAAVRGYGELLGHGRYPLAVVHVEVPAGLVDVNVHPQKIEVRFARAQDVHSAVHHVLQAACARAPWLGHDPAEEKALRVYPYPPRPPATPAGAATARDRGSDAIERERIDQALELFKREDRRNQRLPFAPPAPPATEQGARIGPAPPPPRPRSTSESGFFASLNYLGQLHRTYLVCEHPGELVLIDQHAAHERVTFERLRNAYGKRQIRTQRLLFPAVLELTPEQAATVESEAAALTGLGFEIEPIGPRSFALKAVPQTLVEGQALDTLREILDQMAGRDGREGAPGGEGALGGPDAMDLVLATMACHSVVRAGDVLDEARARALLDSMDGIDFRAHCPHGRPVLLRLPLAELERRFGRT